MLFLGMAVARSPTVDLAVAAEQPGMVRLAQPCCRLNEGIEYGLQIATFGHSLNYLLGALLKLQRHIEAEGLGGL